MPARIWFTKGLSNTSDAISIMRADPAAQGLSFMASHVDTDNPVRQIADEFVQEPADLDDSDYAQWVLETAIQHQVALIVVQRKTDAVWAFRTEFAAQGVRLQITAAPEVRALLDNKIQFQIDIRSPETHHAGVIGHVFREYCTLAEFDAAWSDLSTNGNASHGLCVKPAQGIFGSGFRRVQPGLDDMAQILSYDPEAGFRISLAAYRNALAAAEKPVPQLLMPYLPGIERSVDFVAHNGQMLHAVCRAKLGKSQQIEIASPSIEMARVLAARYQLDGLCNLQTRENSEGQQTILEINPRMSGGMAMACLAGVNLPLASVFAGLGWDQSGFNEPLEGAFVGTQSVARLLTS
ncbi:ATP-grasp domain-containing protein [Granulosicoccus antarcticus]|uniref:ATP-grasp domain-containing protein n=1 Tax=Granulosicoccus antarcticus IMCC3135 TaxID=1192854 RepID=A0A2Z2NM83_9GAMM|nr:ATP-grasp domain-containing protein [Granulosicoccus antarcticus]ASJ72456.1 hypothetical protein IMCC3135_11830 [Granulosicoccus antarcticus IMCC3135]